MGNNSLKGKVVLVTGAGSGLGEATARAFAHAGCNVVCIDINGEAAEHVRRELSEQEKESKCIALQCDVSNAEAVFKRVEAVEAHFGRLDIVANCAAIDHTVSVNEMTIEQWDQVINVNLRGPFLLAKAALPMMRRQRSGHIFNIASTAATRAWANAAAYHASKWGLVGFSRGLGVEGRADGIRVTTIIPGGMRTHFFDRFADQGIPMPDEQNLQDPANVAQVIVFAAQVPPESALQEVIITPVTETSWP
jgi:NAD(P)-dependent dehydrogenase (short-subunit alcohol dehydrogenase family)